jgi:hypothetical protein
MSFLSSEADRRHHSAQERKVEIYMLTPVHEFEIGVVMDCLPKELESLIPPQQTQIQNPTTSQPPQHFYQILLRDQQGLRN